MRKIFNFTATLALVGVLSLGMTLPVFASQTKHKAARRVAASQPIVTYACEGTDARIASNAINGNSRNEYKLSFGLRLNRANGTATILGASGSNIIHSGHYIISSVGRGFEMFMDWIDSSNNSQTIQLSFDDNGSFSGSSSESGNNSDPAYQMMCTLLGPEFCGLTNVYITRKVTGVCWQQ